MWAQPLGRDPRPRRRLSHLGARPFHFQGTETHKDEIPHVVRSAIVVAGQSRRARIATATAKYRDFDSRHRYDAAVLKATEGTRKHDALVTMPRHRLAGLAAALGRVIAVLAVTGLAASATAAAEDLAPSRCGTVRPFDAGLEAQSDPAAPRLQAYIARRTGVTSFETQAAITNKLQDELRKAHFALIRESGGKGLRIRTGLSGCTAADIDIVEISLPPEADTPGEAFNEIHRQVQPVPLTLWVGVLADIGEIGRGGGRALGQGGPPSPAQDVTLDDGAAAQMSPGNTYAEVILHEAFHAMGAVNSNALHGDGRGHVPTPDLMDASASGIIIDVGHDDYFNPGGSITGRTGQPIWNLYDSLFLCPPGTCFGAVNRPTVTVSSSIQNSRARFAAQGAAYYRWYLDGFPALTASGPIFDAPLNRQVGVRGFAVDGAVSPLQTSSVTAPPTTSPPPSLTSPPPSLTSPPPSLTSPPPSLTSPPPSLDDGMGATAESADHTRPIAIIGVSRSFRLGRPLAVTVTCPQERCSVHVSGSSRTPRRGRMAARTFRARPVARSIAAGTKVQLKLRFSRTTTTMLRRVLQQANPHSARLTLLVVASDMAANRRTFRRVVRIRR